MDKKTISIVDYGVNNILNVIRAISYLGYPCRVINTPEEVLTADKIILPGVGAFANAMDALKIKNLDFAIKEYVRTKERPLFGICLGMQLLLESSSEFGEFEGLGIVEGKVVKIPDIISPLESRRIPHIGWNYLDLNNSVCTNGNKNNLFENINNGDCVYFVHSYMVKPKDTKIITSVTDYEGLKIPSTFVQNNVAAAQFHPERSGKVGLLILENFIKNF